PIDEDHPLLPINYYGYSKLIIEQNLKWFSKLKGIRYASLRYFNAAGYDSDCNKFQVESDPQNLIPLVMEVALEKRYQLKVFGDDYATPDGTGIRDYIHVKDLAEGHLASIDYIIKNNKNLEINLGTGEGFSVLDIVKLTEIISNKKINYVISDRRAGDPDIVLSSSKKAKQLIGWSPTRSDLDNIIKSSWDTYSYNMKVNKL
ncbi:MAG: NAD-dependent epimerase/dehydratase family protein, partial [bacterium]